jgi:hypothetical protein
MKAFHCPPELEDLVLRARRGALMRAEARALDAHVATCESCRMSLALGQIAGPLPPVGADDEAMAARLVARALAPRSVGGGARAGGAPVSRRAARGVRRRARLPRWATVAAALALTAGAASAALWTGRRIFAPAPPQATPEATPAKARHAARSAAGARSRIEEVAPAEAPGPAEPAAPPAGLAPEIAVPAALPPAPPLGAPVVAAAPARRRSPAVALDAHRAATTPPALAPPVAPAAPAEAPQTKLALPEEARADADAPAPTSEDVPDVLLRAANAARRARRIDEAIRFYLELQSRFPTSKQAVLSHLSLGSLALGAGSYESALAEFDIYLSSGGPELSEEALLGKAKALAGLGRTAEEREVWRVLESRSSQYRWRARQRLGELDGRGAP